MNWIQLIEMSFLVVMGVLLLNVWQRAEASQEYASFGWRLMFFCLGYQALSDYSEWKAFFAYILA